MDETDSNPTPDAGQGLGEVKTKKRGRPKGSKTKPRPGKVADAPTKLTLREGRTQYHTSAYLTEGDLKLLRFIQETLVTSKSEAIRSALRAYAMHLERVIGK